MNDDTTADKRQPLRATPYIRSGDNGDGQRTETDGVRLETDPLWPHMTDRYEAAGSPDKNEIPRLVVVMGKDGFKPDGIAYHVLQYAHIGAGTVGFDVGGQWFEFPFHDPLQPKLLRAHGRSILRYADYISLRRLSWIRLADRDFRPGDGSDVDKPIFTRIEVTDMLPPR